MYIKKHIPNLITLCNLFAGCIAVVFAMMDQLELAALFVVIGIFFDFFDGLAARVLKVQSELGLQLDSLADMVTSGVVPGLILFQLFHKALGFKNVFENIIDTTSGLTISSYIPFIGLIVILASAYRLAKFNIDTRQTTSFIGVPTPANTLLIISLPLILTYQDVTWAETLILNQWFLIVLTLVCSYLLNAEIGLFALKFKTWDFASNKLRYVFIMLTIALLVGLHFIAIPIIIFLYVILSMIFTEKQQ